jgi:hypothetical protein
MLTDFNIHGLNHDARMKGEIEWVLCPMEQLFVRGFQMLAYTNVDIHLLMPEC